MSEKYLVGEGKYRVMIYAPTASTANRWRLKWKDGGKDGSSTAKDKVAAFDKAGEVAARLKRRHGQRANLPLTDLVDAYLDPNTRMIAWGKGHADDQEHNFKRFTTHLGAAKKCKDVSNDDILSFINSIASKSSRKHLMVAVSGLLTWAYPREWIITNPDSLMAGAGYTATKKVASKDAKSVRLVTYIDRKSLPSHKDVDALAKAMAITGGNWRYELLTNLAAYSGVRLGELINLSPSDFSILTRSIHITSQCLDVGGKKSLSLPKNASARHTIYPTKTPEGYPLAKMVAKRIKEAEAEGPKKLQDGTRVTLMFPAYRGGWISHGSFGTNIRRPAQVAAGWKKQPNGKFLWTWHTLRHVFCSWLIYDAGKDVRDVSKSAGHKSVLTTISMYVNTDDDVLKRLGQGT
jgi:integrase